jgi:hypothetical protein
MSQRQMHLVAFLMTGPTCHHHGAWRHRETEIGDILSRTHYEHIARVLEAGCFDAQFFAIRRPSASWGRRRSWWRRPSARRTRGATSS